MKPQWTNFSNAFADFNNKLSEFTEGIQDTRTQKAAKILTTTWNKLVYQHNEFDKLVEPIRARAFTMPFPSAEFSEIWITYKEYLLEDHNAYIGSRRESIMLKRLKKLADGNERRAIDMVEYFISSGYKSIFKPSEKQLAGEEPAKVETEQTIDTTKKVAQL